MKHVLLSVFSLLAGFLSCAQTTVKLTKIPNGGYLIPCMINGNVTTFGESYLAKQINIRSLKIGNLVLYNILAIIVEGDAPMLLGQTALQQFGEYTINNKTSILSINGNFKSDLDLALAAAKKKWQAKNVNIQQQLEQTKTDILRDRKIAENLQFEVAKIDFNEKQDGQLRFRYDITNNSGLDYKRKAYSQLSIFIDVYTKEGRVYSTSVSSAEMPAGNTINGMDLIVKIRNYTPTAFRIYGVVNGPLLSTLEN